MLTISVLIILLISIVTICGLKFYFSSRNQKVSIFFNNNMIYIQTFIFWIATSFIATKFQTSFSDDKDYFVYYLLLSLFLVILKPTATYFTGLIKNRKSWIITSYAILIILFTVSYIKELDKISMFFEIIVLLMLGFSMSSQSLFFLYYNEQKHNRKEPIKSSFIIMPIICFGTLIGSSMWNIDNNFSIMDLFLIYILLIASIVFVLYLKENKENIKVFDSQEIPVNGRYTVKTLIFIILVSILLAFSFSFLTNRVTFNSYDIQDKSYFYLIGGILFSIPLYFLIFKRINIFISFIVLMILAMLLTLLLFLSSNLYIIYFLCFAYGLLYYLSFQIIFSMAIMWNYRVSKRPITGFCAAGFAFGSLLMFIFEWTLMKTNILNDINNFHIVCYFAIIISFLTALILTIIGRKYIFGENIFAKKALIKK